MLMLEPGEDLNCTVVEMNKRPKVGKILWNVADVLFTGDQLNKLRALIKNTRREA